VQADWAANTGQIESNYDETVDSFDDMNLKSELLRGKATMVHRQQTATPTPTAADTVFSV